MPIPHIFIAPLFGYGQTIALISNQQQIGKTQKRDDSDYKTIQISKYKLYKNRSPSAKIVLHEAIDFDICELPEHEIVVFDVVLD